MRRIALILTALLYARRAGRSRARGTRRLHHHRGHLHRQRRRRPARHRPRPAAGAARRPGLVLLEGAGNRGRPYLRPEAEAYARHGVVTLVYDKRTAGYSTLHRDYSVLADDALAGLRLLRDRPDVDPARLGLWALSEGAWVAPIAANRSTEVAFLITVGAVGTTRPPRRRGRTARTCDTRGSAASCSASCRRPRSAPRSTWASSPRRTSTRCPLWQQVRQPVLAQWGQLDRDAVPAAQQPADRRGPRPRRQPPPHDPRRRRHQPQPAPHGRRRLRPPADPAVRLRGLRDRLARRPGLCRCAPRAALPDEPALYPRRRRPDLLRCRAGHAVRLRRLLPGRPRRPVGAVVTRLSMAAALTPATVAGTCCTCCSCSPPRPRSPAPSSWGARCRGSPCSCWPWPRSP